MPANNETWNGSGQPIGGTDDGQHFRTLKTLPDGTVVVSGAGGGGDTQYVDGVTQATPTGTAILGKNPSNVLKTVTLDASGNVNVNLAAGSISGGNAAASPTGAAVPASADYVGFNSGGNLVGVSPANPLPTSLASLPALAAGSAVIGHVINDASTAVIGHVIVDSGAGGGTQYAEGTTQPTPTGTVALGKDPSNVVKALPLTAAGNLQVDASAVAVPLAASSAVIGHVINDASSAVIGHVIADSGSTTAVTGNVTVVQPTAANLNATVTGTVTTAPPANASTNVAQIAGTAPDVNSGLKSAGTLRVVLATDQPALTNKLLVTPDSVALPANQSVNVNQVAGTSPDVNSGVKSAGTLRVVLATDQPALTNKLLVTPDSVALPANQSVNVNQVAGSTADTNSGLKSAGTLRVVLATDQPALTNKLLVTPDSVALPANQSVNVNQVAGAAINSANPMPVVGTIGTNTTAPAAGAEFSFTVTAGKKWRVIGLRASLVTNATVVSRFIRIVIDNGTNIIFAVYADDGQVASDSRNYNFVPGQLTTSDVRGERVIGLPENLWLNAAWRIRSLTDSIQTTDQWSNVTLAVEEMPNL